MARLTFPDEGSRIIYDPDTGKLLPAGTRVHLYLDDAATVVATDLTDKDGTPITVGYVQLDAYRRLPDFNGPNDQRDTLFAVVNNGPISPVYANTDVRLDTLASRVTAVESTAGAAIPLTQRAAANGVATLDGAGTIPDAQIPAAIARDAEVTSSVAAAVAALVNSAPGTLDTLGEIATALQADESTAAALATTVAGKQPLDPDLTTIAALDSATPGALVTDGSGWFRKTYAQLKTALGLTKGDVGLGNVDNTSDANKPVSTAQAAADAAVAAAASADATAKVTAQHTADNGTYAPLLVPLYAKRPSQPRSDIRWLTNFQSGHGWTSAGTVTTFTDDTSVYSLGTQSAKVTLGTASANGWIFKAGMTAMDLTGKVVVVRLRVEDLALISQIEVDIGDTTFANRYVMVRWTSTVFAAVNQQWVDVMFDISEASVTGTPNRAAITDVKFRFFSNGTATSGNPLTIHVQAVGFLSSLAAAYPNGVVTFSFDDGFSSQYTAGKSYLDKYGYSGTLYTIVERLGQAGFMSNAQVQSLHYDSGWEIAGHAYTAAAHDNRLTSLSTADLQTEMANLKQWLVVNGFPSESFAYPGGVFNTADATVMQTVAQFFSTARTTVNNPLYNVAPPLQPMLTSQRDMATGTTNLATQLTVVGTEKLWMNFMCHGIDTGSVVSCTSAVFQAVVDQVAATSVAVATVDDVIRKSNR